MSCVELMLTLLPEDAPSRLVRAGYVRQVGLLKTSKLCVEAHYSSRGTFWVLPPSTPWTTSTGEAREAHSQKHAQAGYFIIIVSHKRCARLIYTL